MRLTNDVSDDRSGISLADPISKDGNSSMTCSKQYRSRQPPGRVQRQEDRLAARPRNPLRYVDTGVEPVVHGNTWSNHKRIRDRIWTVNPPSWKPEELASQFWHVTCQLQLT